MKKNNLKGISEILSEKELKNVLGGSGCASGRKSCTTNSDCYGSGSGTCKLQNSPNGSGTAKCCW